MSYKFVIAVLFLCLSFTVRFSFAQTQTYSSVKIDSLTAAQVKAILNQLPTDPFQKRIYQQQGKALPYRLLLPKNYDKNKKYPLVISFHNSTRIGNDNEKQLEPLARIWLRTEIQEKYPCFVLAPQFNARSSSYITNRGGVLESKPSSDINLILNLLKQLEREFGTIDQNRIYLIGYSMGASTAQNLMSLAPEKFAALASLAAVPDFSNLKAMSRKDILLIHGQKDGDNPYQGSVELFNQLKGNPKATFITFTELDHNNIHIPFLLSAQIPQWLFGKHR